jgi:hypothetical protein
MYIASQILLTVFSTFSSPDVCDVVSTRTGTPTICVPHEEGAPVYNADVCCTSRACAPATSTCVTGTKRFHCELGAVDALGLVSCYFEVPNYCHLFPCALEIGIAPQAEAICCEGGVCTPYFSGDTCDPANIYHCDNVKENGDGTVTCVDGDE